MACLGNIQGCLRIYCGFPKKGGPQHRPPNFTTILSTGAPKKVYLILGNLKGCESGLVLRPRVWGLVAQCHVLGLAFVV